MTEGANRRWRVEVFVAFPTTIPLAPDGGFPQTLEPQSRVPVQTHTVNDKIGIRPVTEKEAEHRERHPSFSWGVIFAEVEARDIGTAYESAVDAMESVVESLSFQLQAPLQIHGIAAIDVTPPVEVGEQRECGQVTGYPLRRFSPAAVQMSGVITQTIPDMRIELSALDRRQRAALDWYLKALAAQFQVDQFMFLWIAFEIFSDLSDLLVEGPLMTRCHHEIESCPSCGKPTNRVIQGPLQDSGS